MAVFSNSTAMSARKVMDRRTLLRGAAALAPAAALLGRPEPAKASNKDIARRIHALASEMSWLLADLDEGMWDVRVAPPFCGAPIFAVEPNGLDPQDRLDRSIGGVLRALNELHPGQWRHEVCLGKGGFVVIVNDGMGRGA